MHGGGVSRGGMMSAERREMRALVMRARGWSDWSEEQLLRRMESDPRAVGGAADGVVEVSGHGNLR